MTKDEFRDKMLPLWSFRNDGGNIGLNFEIMGHIQSVCLDFLSGQVMDKPKKLKAIFVMGALIGYHWEIGGEKFCQAFLEVFEEE